MREFMIHFEIIWMKLYEIIFNIIQKEDYELYIGDLLKPSEFERRVIIFMER